MFALVAFVFQIPFSVSISDLWVWLLVSTFLVSGHRPLMAKWPAMAVREDGGVGS